MDDVTDASL